MDKIRPAANDPLPSQQVDDRNPAAIVVQDNEDNEAHLEWTVQNITDERTRQGKTMYLVHWEGYKETTWEPAEHLSNTQALQTWLDSTRPVRLANGRLQRNWRTQHRKLLKEQRSASAT